MIYDSVYGIYICLFVLLHKARVMLKPNLVTGLLSFHDVIGTSFEFITLIYLYSNLPSVQPIYFVFSHIHSISSIFNFFPF